MLADGDAGVDYHRRRQLNYTGLLPDREWIDICRQAGARGKTRNAASIARCFLFEQISGMPARSAPFAVDDWEFRNRVADFPRILTPEISAAACRYTEEFLCKHNIRDEPTVWHPPTTMLDDLGVWGQNATAVDIAQLHRLIRVEHQSIADTAKQLRTTADAVRHALELHPAPTSRPTVHPKPVAAARRQRPAEAYQRARLHLTRTEFVELYQRQRMPLGAIGARVGVSRGVITRLAHDYGITLREAGNRNQYAIDRDWLYTQYITERRSLNDIANECAMIPTTVARFVKSYNIPIRPSGGASHTTTDLERHITERAAPMLGPALASTGGWKRLQRFADAANHPTLSAAAAKLGLQSGRLVVQIRWLEREFEQKLIIRAERGRPMQLTDFGNQVVEAVQGIRSGEGPRLGDAELARDPAAHGGRETLVRFKSPHSVGTSRYER